MLGCGFFALGAFVWPLGVLLGVIVLIRSRRRRYSARVRRRAIVGLVGSAIGLCWLIVTMWGLNSLYGPWGSVRQSILEARLRGTAMALAEYARSYGGEFPPTPAAWAKTIEPPQSVLFGPNHRAESGHTVTDWHYVQGLNASSPPDWIVFYADSSQFNHKGGAILTVDGTVRLLDEPEFSATIDRFRREYERSKHEPPRIIPPE